MRVLIALSSFLLGASLADNLINQLIPDVDFDNVDCSGDACFMRNQLLSVDRSKTDPKTGLVYNERSLAYANTQSLLPVCLPNIAKEAVADSFTSCEDKKMEDICVFTKRGWLVKDAQEESVANVEFLKTTFSKIEGGAEAVNYCLKIKEEAEADDYEYEYYDYADYYDEYDYLEEGVGVERRVKREAGKEKKDKSKKKKNGKGGRRKAKKGGKEKSGKKNGGKKGAGRKANEGGKKKSGKKNGGKKGKGRKAKEGGKKKSGKKNGGKKGEGRKAKEGGKKKSGQKNGGKKGKGRKANEGGKKKSGQKNGGKKGDGKNNGNGKNNSADRKFVKKPSKKPSEENVKQNLAKINARLNKLGLSKLPVKSTLDGLECMWNELEDLLIKCGEKAISNSP